MPLTMGSRLGPYEITAAIGAGGMGEVYRARDTKLGRDVAIKVLPDAFAHDASRMARFQREAKLLAALNHPNIASIYGLEDTDSARALVMEFAEGPTLADRISGAAPMPISPLTAESKTAAPRSGQRRPLPTEDALHIARQIADALEYAHERGIIHRDLKPANIKVAADDTVKILDFGLAKALETELSVEDIANSPTLSRMATQAGVLLGTASYMSPEQAKAKPVDRRGDIWAFGCVLFEMLTGKMAFHGDTVTDTLAAVIKEEPDWSQLPAATPMRVRVLLQRCLQKDAKQRLRDIGDARISLDEVLSGAPEGPASLAAAPAVSAPAWRRAIPWAVAGVAVLAALTIAFVHLRVRPTPAIHVQRFEIAAPDPAAYGVVISPDGTRLVFFSLPNPSRLWLRRMDSPETRPIEGTEGAAGFPFWSPDSRFIAFGTPEGKLKKIETEGGTAQVLCDSGFILGGFWTPDGRIVFGDPTRPPGIWEVSAAGGVASPFSGLAHDNPFLGSPVLLPDGLHFLYVSGGVTTADVYVGSLDRTTGQPSPRKLLTGAISDLAYAASPDDFNLGYLLFARPNQAGTLKGTLMAQPLDLGKLDTMGEPIPIAEQVISLSASLTGTLAYSSGAAPALLQQLTTFDRQGKILGTAGEPGVYQSVAFSPDGSRVVASRLNLQSGKANLWMIDLARGINSRFTFDSGVDDAPVWSPDGNRIAFFSDRGGKNEVYQKLANGGSEDELLLKMDYGIRPLSWSRDGRFLLFGGGAPISEVAVSVVPMDANGRAAGKPFSFAQKGVGIEERFSPGPNGRPLWIAYSSNESGRYEIYVRPFDPNSPTGTPPGGGKWQVSTQGGLSPRWNDNGKELLYVTPDGTVMAVEVSGGPVFQSGIPKPLFKPKGFATQGNTAAFWDVTSDGKKFIFAVSASANAPAAQPARFTVVLNWQAALKK